MSKENPKLKTLEGRVTFLETSKRLTEQELSKEEIEAKINELTQKRQSLNDELQQIAEEEQPKRDEIWQQIDLINAELQAYEQALAAVIVGTAGPSGSGAAEEGKAKEQGNDDEEGKQEKLRQAQKDRAEKYGISPKEGGHLTKPDEYADISEDQFADPVNYRYPVDKEHAAAALKYFNQPDNREAGGYSHEEAVKVMQKIIKGCLAGDVEVAYQSEDPVYRDLPEELKKKLTGYEEPSQTATEQQDNQEPEKDEHGCIIGKERYDEEAGKCVPLATEEAVKIVTKLLEATEQAEDMTVEEIRQKIVDLAKQKEDLQNKLWPEPSPSPLSDEERITIQAQIDVLYAEIEAYEQALAAKIAGQGAVEKKRGLGEAIIAPGTSELEPSDLISKREVLALIPDKRVWRSWSYGPQMLVKQLKHKFEGD